MIDSLAAVPPWTRFREFIAPGADRFAILKELIEEAGLEYRIITIAGNRHFFIAPPRPEEEYLRRRPTIITAHYDRSQGSPGANDNSAAVFILLETAGKLRREKTYNWMVIFTDKEELKSGEGITDQGAYTLAEAMRETELETSRIFNFDACGTGDTLLISTTAEYLLKNEKAAGEKIRTNIKELREAALETARDLRMAKVLLAPTPLSDDAGFLRAGITAQTITMLPAEECTLLVSMLRRTPDYTEALVNLELRNAYDHRSIPETWRIFNSPSDSHLRLTPGNFRIVGRFAEALCK